MCLASYILSFAHNNFKLDENGGEFSERVENTMGTVEIARLNHISIKLQLLIHLQPVTEALCSRKRGKDWSSSRSNI